MKNITEREFKEALDVVRKAVKNGNVTTNRGLDGLVIMNNGEVQSVFGFGHMHNHFSPAGSGSECVIHTTNSPIKFKSDYDLAKEKLDLLKDRGKRLQKELEEVKAKAERLERINRS